MFKLIKWSLIILFFVSIWFVFSYFSNLNDIDRQTTKKEAIEAIEQENPNIFLMPLREKMKEEAIKRKQGLLESAKIKIKSFINFWFE